MNSGGTYERGHDEIRDVRAAIDRSRDEAPGEPGVVCGWSFGANVALREALDDPRMAALALVGIPLRPGDVELPALPRGDGLRGLRAPVLLLAGEHDEFCPRGIRLGVAGSSAARRPPASRREREAAA